VAGQRGGPGDARDATASIEEIWRHQDEPRGEPGGWRAAHRDTLCRSHQSTSTARHQTRA
jgi:hypothetical protein